MSTNIKLSKAQISKIVQSGGILGSLLSKLAGALMTVAVSLVKKRLSTIRNNSSYLNNQCRNSKESTQLRNNNLNNFRRRNEENNGNCSSS